MLYRFSGVPKKAVYAFGACICFGLFSRRMFTDTMYYWAGVIAYIIPLTFMFGAIFIYRHLQASDAKPIIYVLILYFLSFLTSISQEQICFTYCVMIGLLSLRDLITFHKLKIYQWGLLVICATGAISLFLAPGNFARLGIQDYLIEPNYRSQVYKNIKMFFAIFYQKDNLVFLLAFMIMICYLAYAQMYPFAEDYTNDGYEKSGLVFYGICMWSSILFLQSVRCEADATVFYWDPTTATDGYVINALLYSEMAGFLIYRKLKEINDIYLSVFVISSLLSVISTFFYSYYMTARMTVTLLIAILDVILRIFSTIESPMRKYIFGTISIFSCFWLALFMYGYWSNTPIHQQNDEILASTAARMRAGEPVILDGLSENWNTYFIPERVYAHDVDRGIVEYYDFPSGVQFLPSPPTIYFEGEFQP